MRKKLFRFSLALLALAAATTATSKKALAASGCPADADVGINVNGQFGLYDCYFTSGIDCSQCQMYCPDLPGSVIVNECED